MPTVTSEANQCTIPSESPTQDGRDLTIPSKGFTAPPENAQSPCCQWRVCREQIEPFPPLYSPGKRVPLFVLVIPFTVDDAQRYADRHNLLPDAPNPDRLDEGCYHLESLLPRRYCRWALIFDDSVEGIVLASNYSQEDLRLGFDIDTLEQIRRLMGVDWMPMWALTDSVYNGTSLRSRPNRKPLPWPRDLEHQPPVTEEDLRQLPDDKWRRMLVIYRLRLQGLDVRE